MGNARKWRKMMAMQKEDPALTLARSLHIQIFPEEYDCILDSIADAYERSKGINPMSSEYIERVNKRRAKLGFGPYPGGALDDSTQGWVTQNVRAGEEQRLIDIWNSLRDDGDYS
jgi:hypothetical protein